MNEVGVNRQYNDLIGRYKSVPFAQSISFDVNQYVTEKATDGLFFVVAQEEKKIRTNPAARVTDLLKEVFGKKKMTAAPRRQCASEPISLPNPLTVCFTLAIFRACQM
jgi:hypothetical protein